MTTRKPLLAVDMFCGAGGATQALHEEATARGLRFKVVAINHWERAIETHAANFPGHEHLCTGIESLKPSHVVPGGYLDLLMAGPECTHHSRARGGKPCDDQSRASAWHILHWCQELYVRHVVIENVPEFVEWGPLDAQRRPIASRKGETFRAFTAAMESLGYRLDYRIQCAADYGDATTRRRFFLQARRGNRRVTWADATHTPNGERLLFGTTQPYRAAREIIDWTLPCPSINLPAAEARKLGIRRPLCQNTLDRIACGIRKFWGEWAEPFLVVLNGTTAKQVEATALPITNPLPSITGCGHVGLVQPFILGQQSGSSPRSVSDPLPTVAGAGAIAMVQPFVCCIGQTGSGAGRVSSVDEPIRTLVSKAEHCLVQPFMVKFHGGERAPRVHSLGEPLRTMDGANRFGLVQPFLVQFYGTGSNVMPASIPLGTCTGHDRFGLVAGDTATLDIGFRMLEPHELARAHSFPDSYKFTGTKADQVLQIGNSWPIRLGRSIVGQGLEAA